MPYGLRFCWKVRNWWCPTGLNNCSTSEFSLLTPAVPLYKVSRVMKMDWLLKHLLLPADYKDQINALNMHP
ncbi:hypothetical protein [Niabella hibiscisoli]|uniref:hypothetical protein n=1 Tax=Niabella hibiscisoli TaxID=1825928 RepID=UPI001F0EF181|nr:hypothetical protein [Niabella hibiscisoli]MCH5718500.1 hypothetical protein [Niabella hibiscisoli]